MIFPELDTDDALPDLDEFGPGCPQCGYMSGPGCRRLLCLRCYSSIKNFRIRQRRKLEEEKRDLL